MKSEYNKKKSLFVFQWEGQGKELSLILITMAVAFLLGNTVMRLLMHFDSDVTFSVPMGSGLALVFGLLVQMFIRIFEMMNQFNLAVSMGVTRKRLIPAMLVFSVAEMILVILLSAILCGLECVVMGISVAELWSGLAMNGVRIGWWILALVGIPVLEFWGGAMCLRFGMKFFWVIWGLGVFSSPIIKIFFKILDWLENTAVLKRLTTDGAMGIVTMIWVILFVTAVCLLRRQRVTL